MINNPLRNDDDQPEPRREIKPFTTNPKKKASYKQLLEAKEKFKIRLLINKRIDEKMREYLPQLISEKMDGDEKAQEELKTYLSEQGYRIQISECGFVVQIIKATEFLYEG